MNNLFILYKYEFKKLLQKKMVWISILIMVVIIVLNILLPLLGGYYVDGVKVDNHYHLFHEGRAFQMALTGQSIDQSLLDKMKDGYDKIPESEQRYTLTDEYLLYARPYSAIFNYVRSNTNMTTEEALHWEADEQDMYNKRQHMIENLWSDSRLSQKEKVFWQSWENQLEKPVKFSFREGYWVIFDSVNTIGLMSIIAIALCLCGVFTDEHSRKTDQLLLSTRLGRKQLYCAKIFTGLSFSFIISLLFTLLTFGLAFLLFGAEGGSYAFQLIYPQYSYPLTIAQGVFLSYGMMVAAIMVTGIFVMILAELLRNNVAVLGLVLGVLILGMFVQIPTHMRILSQIWSILPNKFIEVWNIFSYQTVSIFGKLFLPWQIVPVFYLLTGIIVFFAGKKLYSSYQISGR